MSIFDPHKPQYGDKIERAELGSALQQPSYDFILAHYRQHGDKSDIPAEQILPLAKRAVAENDSKTALALIDGFSQAYPNHPDTVAIYCLAATVMQRDFGQSKDAQALLERLAEQYPDNPEIAHTRALLDSEET